MYSSIRYVLQDGYCYIVVDEKTYDDLVVAWRENYQNHGFLKGIYFKHMSKKNLYQMTIPIENKRNGDCNNYPSIRDQCLMKENKHIKYV
jgi:hypothetical protein